MYNVYTYTLTQPLTHTHTHTHTHKYIYTCNYTYNKMYPNQMFIRPIHAKKLMVQVFKQKYLQKI